VSVSVPRSHPAREIPRLWCRSSRPHATVPSSVAPDAMEAGGATVASNVRPGIGVARRRASFLDGRPDPSTTPSGNIPRSMPDCHLRVGTKEERKEGEMANTEQSGEMPYVSVNDSQGIQVGSDNIQYNSWGPKPPLDP